MTELAASLGCVYELCVDYDSHDDGTPYCAWWIRLPASEHARLGKDGLPLAIGPLRQYLTTQPKPDPEAPGGFLPNGAASKAALNRSINDAGWGVFLTILHAKAESAGREVIAVDPVTPPGPAPNAVTSQRRTGPPRTRSAASRAATTRTRTRWAP